jgi:hypothetical protein
LPVVSWRAGAAPDAEALLTGIADNGPKAPGASSHGARAWKPGELAPSASVLSPRAQDQLARAQRLFTRNPSAYKIHRIHSVVTRVKWGYMGDDTDGLLFLHALVRFPSFRDPLCWVSADSFIWGNGCPFLTRFVALNFSILYIRVNLTQRNFLIMAG